MKFGQTVESRAEETAKLAVRHLVHYSPLPALALESQLRLTTEPAQLPGQTVFARVAKAEGLFLATVIQPDGAEFEHVLFLAKVQGLADEELISCRRPRTFNRHDPRDRPQAV